MKTVYIAQHKTQEHTIWTQGYPFPERHPEFTYFKVRARTNQQGYVKYLNGEATKA